MTAPPTPEERVAIRSTGEMLKDALRFNAYANWAVAVAQTVTAFVVYWAWQS